MPHDVFVSYSSRDKPTADAVVAKLEARGVRCWIAPRDILPGRDWSEAIIDGIEGSRVFVLVFSANANSSAQVKREIERAVNRGLTIVPLKIEDVAPARTLEYFLGTPHWLDALTPPLERHLEYLADSIQFLLGSGEEPVPPPVRVWSRRNRLLIAVAGFAIVAMAAGWATLGQIADANDSADRAEEFVQEVAGDWTYSSTDAGLKKTWLQTFKESSRYNGELKFEEQGTYRLEGPALFLSPDGGQARAVSWSPTGSAVTAALLEPPGMAVFLRSLGSYDYNLAVSSPVLEKTEARLGMEVWSGERPLGRYKFAFTLELAAGRYSFSAVATDRGTVEFTESGWRTVSEVSGIQEGVYELLGADRLLIKWSEGAFGPPASLLFERD